MLQPVLGVGWHQNILYLTRQQKALMNFISSGNYASQYLVKSADEMRVLLESWNIKVYLSVCEVHTKNKTGQAAFLEETAKK